MPNGLVSCLSLSLDKRYLYVCNCATNEGSYQQEKGHDCEITAKRSCTITLKSLSPKVKELLNISFRGLKDQELKDPSTDTDILPFFINVCSKLKPETEGKLEVTHMVVLYTT